GSGQAGLGGRDGVGGAGRLVERRVPVDLHLVLVGADPAGGGGELPFGSGRVVGPARQLGAGAAGGVFADPAALRVVGVRDRLAARVGAGGHVAGVRVGGGAVAGVRVVARGLPAEQIQGPGPGVVRVVLPGGLLALGVVAEGHPVIQAA